MNKNKANNLIDLIIYVSSLLFVFIAFGVLATNNHPPLIEKKFQHIRQHSNLSTPILPVAVIKTDTLTLNHMYCKASRCKPSPLALSHNGKIYINKDISLSTPYGDSLLYHELVHVAQYHTKGNAKDCYEWQEREKTAYMLQWKWNDDQRSAAYDSINNEEVELMIDYSHTNNMYMKCNER